MKIEFGADNRDRVSVFRNPESLVNEEACIVDAELRRQFCV